MKGILLHNNLWRFEVYVCSEKGLFAPQKASGQVWVEEKSKFQLLPVRFRAAFHNKQL